MVMGVGNSFPFECKRPEAGGWAMGMVRSRQSGARGGTTTSRERAHAYANKSVKYAILHGERLLSSLPVSLI